MEKLKVGFISLGCDKNRIDSEIVLNKLVENNFELVNNPKQADIIIVNTCAFIDDAKQESINTILEMAEYKKNKCKIVIATGCLAQRYGKDLMNLMPEVDIVLGVNDYDKLIPSIKSFLKSKDRIIQCSYSNEIINAGRRILTTGKSSAYIRIAEGCNNYCAYCIIPKIRGNFRSRPIEDIFKEAESLANQGVQELILVAQDTTKYGIDLYHKKMLPNLLKKLSIINGIKWIRILYCYPEEINDELIQEISENDKVCKYIDIPIQHISNTVLKNMRRKSNKDQIINAIKKLREYISNITIRTSIIVGFPGETDEDFTELKEFIKEIKFDKLGVFMYSQEENTLAATMKNQISDDIKIKRYNELMAIQQNISILLNKQKIGRNYEVIIEGYKDGYWYGRNYEMSPQIDGEILFKYDKILNIGEFINLKIIDSSEYDLIGAV